MQDIHPTLAGAGTSFPHRRHHHHQTPPPSLNCPRCDSPNTKFCYYNNYNLSQPRHFCKSCRRYWTFGGVLRNVPVGGASRKSSKKPKPKPKSKPRTSLSSSSSADSATAVPGAPTKDPDPDPDPNPLVDPDPNRGSSVVDWELGDENVLGLFDQDYWTHSTTSFRHWSDDTSNIYNNHDYLSLFLP